ncbi:hypothetical protein HGRIS_001872 [Hohenbuehelia grisea]|uniref:Uncharacterized protein n=1 Tax=Hohenbuehelia grisea TaxID=104357 RepID=A0ABR3JIQ0_9AGAR
MSRRQPSTTSLSKFARASSPILDKTTDFCNAFWGPGDAGVDVLFARMRGAQRTVDELRNYWKERSVIEEDYAKRMAKLSKLTLGRDEIGELRNSFDTVRAETDRQSAFHLQLANHIRDLEAKTATFLNRQVHHRKVVQSGIEKEFKAKQTQESYVNKAREKYEADCLRINSYTAQSTLVQGKDLEKVQLKLERAQQTVQQNERDFANFAKALGDTTLKWEQDWKVFCDMCQDLEEGRMEFMRDNLWAYANAVSTVCVSDDESCEKIRLALEQMDAQKEMENFVLDYSTGNMIPDPPRFINYNNPDAVSSSASEPSMHPARFTRSTTRPPRQQSPPPEDPEPTTNAAGVGAGGGNWNVQSETSLSRAPTQSKARAAVQAAQSVQPNGTHEQHGGPEHATHYQNVSKRSSSVSPQPVESPSKQSTAYARSQPAQASRQSVRPTSVSPQPLSQPPSARPTSVSPQPVGQPQQSSRIPHDPHAEPIAHNAETYIKVGQNAYKVDLSKDPQQRPGSSVGKAAGTPASSTLSLSPTGASGPMDPLAKQMEELKRAVSNSGSIRRKETKPAQASPRKSSIPIPSGLSTPISSSASPVGGGAPVRDYRNSAEVVVGAYPSAAPRSASPQPPTAEFMKPQHSGQHGGADVESVVADYQQSLPGERKSVSRRGSYVAPASGPPSNAGHGHSSSLGQNIARPPSSVGHAGIGAHGSRSNSPQPPSRGPSPGPAASPSRTYMPPSQALALNRANSTAQPHRAVSPNNVGIVLDPSGRVMHDEMAQRYQQQRPASQGGQHQPPQQQQQQQPPPQAQAQQAAYAPQQRRSSYAAQTNPAMAPPPPQGHQGYAPPQQQQPFAPPPPSMYQAPPPAQPGYGQPSYGNVPYSSQTPGPYQQAPSQTPGPYQQHPPSQTPGPYSQPPSQTPAPYQPPPTQTPGPYQQPPQQQQSMYQQQQQQQQGFNDLQRGMYYANGHSGSQNLGSQQQVQQQYRTPSPQPPAPQQPPPPQQQQQQQQATGHVTDDNQPILFYVKALYDYTATIDEEFDFQTGDIIAVTATPEDGWWSGELLDERRRQRGRHVFPSNFVCLF